MIIEKNTVVTLHYRLQEDDASGALVEETYGSDPLVFLFGVGQMLPEFESQIEGKKEGDSLSFGIKSEDAYGEEDPDALVKLPLDTFMIDGRLAEEMLVVGNPIPMSDQYGNQLVGIVMEVGEDGVLIDFNHPMAGQDLFFSVTIETVRQATPEEISHGHVHGPGGHDHGDGHHDHDH
ncbi:MAG: FKBP-type peptidyl-prolyl cis-trans isomerase [Saprospiraceae bacterium]|nr:FKBP-type peptidyl-prolyl cis-trans isomerase [Saprospiraceae bacterium]